MPQSRIDRLPKGSIFGRWTVIGIPYMKGTELMVTCQCACGTVQDCQASNLLYRKHRQGYSEQSCGCYRDELLKARIRPRKPRLPTRSRTEVARNRKGSDKANVVIDGVSRMPAEWADIVGVVCRNTIAKRMRSGWSPKEAVYLPPSRGNRWRDS